MEDPRRPHPAVLVFGGVVYAGFRAFQVSVFLSPWIQGKMDQPGENFPLDEEGGGNFLLAGNEKKTLV